MKYFLFIDNFRGFSDTCIPISDVNFLVGENSTGKTSVLGLLKLFSNPNFLFDADLSDEHIGFRHFTDMVSAHSRNQKSFSIGFVSEQSENKKKSKKAREILGCLITFVEEDGLPRPSRFTFSRGNAKLSLLFDKEVVHYKVGRSNPSFDAEQILSVLRSGWLHEHKNKEKGFKKLVTPAGFPSNVPIVMAMSLILGRPAKSSTKKKEKNKEYVFYPPYSGFPNKLIWLAPIRTKPARTYDELTLDFSPEGKHTPYLIRRMLRSKSARSRFHKFISKVGKESGLFQDVRTKNFGESASGPFELDIVLDGKALNVTNVGYGVSQSLPVFVEILARSHGTWFGIQQPEVHLHPRAQAALGDLVYEMTVTDHKLFFIETHSDFMIDRFRMNYKNRRSYKPKSQILFFERQDTHNVVTPLEIKETGNLPVDQPRGYRDFFIKEELRTLGI